MREFLGVDDAALGPYRRDIGRVLMFRRDADGRRTKTVSTGISVTQLDGKRWFVTGVEGGPVLSEPGPGPVISSPVRIVGLGVDGARRVSLRLHAGFEPAPLAVATAVAGPRGQDPFSTVLAFDRRRARRGVIVTRAALARTPSRSSPCASPPAERRYLWTAAIVQDPCTRSPGCSSSAPRCSPPPCSRACGDGDGAAGKPTATAPPTSTVPESLDYALWPDPADADPKDGPSAVARSFVEDFIGVEDPALGAFQQGDSRSGEISVFRRGENGKPGDKVITTIALRQLGDGRRVVRDRGLQRRGRRHQAVLAGRGDLLAGDGRRPSRRTRGQRRPARPRRLRAQATGPAARDRRCDEARAVLRRAGVRATDGQLGAIVARAAQPLDGSDAFVAFPVRFAAG